MKNKDWSRLIGELAAVCSEKTLDEKWLIAPSRRVGFQWLDQATGAGRGVLNVRVKTLPSMALELASAELARKGSSRITEMQGELLIGALFSKLPKKSRGYIANLDKTPGLIEALSNSIRDMRLAGVRVEEIRPTTFEVETKGVEMAALLEMYEAALEKEGLVDDADLFRMATSRLGQDPSAIPKGAVVLLPSDMSSRLKGLVSRMWEAIPGDRKKILEVDRPGAPLGRKPADARLLAWISNPAAAPKPSGDGTASIFSAVGEVGEVREALRRCVKQGIPFDDVEILHTDTGVYVPLIFELGARIDTGDGSGIPMTFAEGIPVRYSRPARALIGLIAWIREGFPQKNLVRMIQEGLLNIGSPKDSALSFTRLGKIFRSVPIGFGADKYLLAIDKAARELAAGIEEADDDEDDDEVKSKESRERDLEGLKGIKEAVTSMLGIVQGEGAPQTDVVKAALDFMAKTARVKGRFDEYSRIRMTNEMNELASDLAKGAELGLDAVEMLAKLAERSHVDGQGPKPGCIHVASIRNGGWSGRGNTFIIGLDDTRFPGGVGQDPLLLDAERRAVSLQLSTGPSRMAEKLQDFELLLARLRGSVTLSFCSRSLTDDRRMFAGSAAIAAYRILSGNREGDHESLAEWLPDPVSFSPSDSKCAIDSTEWWLSRACGEEEVENPERTIASNFEHLRNGQAAIEARQSDRFTEYDGYVPQAGGECDPYRKDSKPLSASRLAALAKNPMDYFFEHVLKISEPEEYATDLSVWLDPLQRGSLLHDVFKDFMLELNKKNLRPDSARDLGLIEKILNKHIDRTLEEIPAPSEEVLAAQVEDMRTIAGIFLDKETEHCKTNNPRYFEASIGMQPHGEGSPIDTPDSPEIVLPGGKTVRAHGRIDRVDEVAGGKARFALWDYKVGGAADYSRSDPNRQGRIIQNTLYLELFKARLREMNLNATVESFGYFFPSLKEYGKRISWPAEDLEPGKETIALLCDMLKTGCFPASNDSDDMKYSDYKTLYEDIEAVCESSVRKLSNPGNKALSPFMALRGYDEEDGDDK